MKCYGTLSLIGASPLTTFCEPLTLEEVKTFLGLPERSPADSEEDAMLEGFVIAAREQAEILQNRDLVEKQYELALDQFTYEIQLRTPLVSVDLGQLTDSAGNVTTLVEDVDYIVDLRRGLVMPPYGRSWPSITLWPSSGVLWRFTSGLATDDIFWSDAGQRVLVGMKHLISAWFNGRLPFENTPGAQVSVEMPYTVTALLSTGAVPRVR